MTADAPLDVVGIGNALVDVLSHETDDFIDTQGLVKSAMTLIEPDRAEQLYAAMGPGIELSGGSAANTIAGVASFGGRAAYMGRVFDDQLGGVFAHDLRAQGVVFDNKPAVDGPPTGRCLIIVTPDGERTTTLSAMALVVIRALAGTPFARPFATQRMSGWMPYCWNANHEPVRPKPA